MNGSMLNGGHILNPIPKDIGYRRTQYAQGFAIAAPSAPSPSYQHTRDMGKSDITITAIQWWNGDDNQWYSMPAQLSFNNGGGGGNAYFRWNKPSIIPPFASGIVTVHGFNATGTPQVLRPSLIVANSAYTNITVPNNGYYVSEVMDNSELTNINGGLFGTGIDGNIDFTSNDNNLLYSIVYSLYR